VQIENIYLKNIKSHNKYFVEKKIDNFKFKILKSKTRFHIYIYICINIENNEI